MYFDYYCDCFRYNVNGNRFESNVPNPAFSKKITWKGKDSEKDKKNKIMHRWNKNRELWIKDIWENGHYYQTVPDSQDLKLNL